MEFTGSQVKRGLRKSESWLFNHEGFRVTECACLKYNYVAKLFSTWVVQCA